MSFKSVKDKIDISTCTIDFLKKKEVFLDGVHFVTGTEKRPSRTKLILVNTLFAIQDSDDDSVQGSLNVNVQDTDTVWIEYVNELIQLYLDESIVGDYRLQYTTEHLFKVSEDLFFKNIKFQFDKIK